MNLNPKVKASTIAGIVVTIFLALAPTLGITEDDSASLVAAVTTLVNFVAGYAKSA